MALQETVEQPFAIFFCSEETAKYTGGGRTAFQKYLQACPGRPTPTTVFDGWSAVKALHAGGVQRFVQVPTTQKNLELMRQYGAPGGGVDTLVICGYNGDALITLSGELCVQSQVTAAMKHFPRKYEAWKTALQAQRRAQRARDAMAAARDAVPQVDYARLATVNWGYSLRAMKAIQEEMAEPFAIFFCSEEKAKYTGGGKAAFVKYRQAFPDRPTHTTVFDEPSTVRALRDAGVRRFVRVATTQENQPLMRKYGATAGADTLVICGYNGDVLITLQGAQSSNVAAAVMDFPQKYEAWKVALNDGRDKERKVKPQPGKIFVKKWWK